MKFLIIILAFLSFVVQAGDWRYQKRIRSLTGNNYIDFIEHKGEIYYFSNANCRSWWHCSSGDLWMQKANSLNSRPGTARKILSNSDLRGYRDKHGTPMTYVRTVGVESDGENIYVLAFIGAPYGSANYYYAPILWVSSDDGRTWDSEGLVNVDGKDGSNTHIFSSSSAYFIEDGIHYYGEDVGHHYGYGRMSFFESYDGINYSVLVDGPISVFPGDRPVFPDADVCNGKYHLLYENGWGRGGDVIRHYVSDDIVNWSLEDSNIGVRDYKGMNITCINDTLYGISNKTLYKYVD